MTITKTYAAKTNSIREISESDIIRISFRYGHCKIKCDKTKDLMVFPSREYFYAVAEWEDSCEQNETVAGGIGNDIYSALSMLQSTLERINEQHGEMRGFMHLNQEAMLYIHG